MKKTATVYYNEGGYYFAVWPFERHATAASMYRTADKLSFTHVEVLHGRYVPGEGFKVADNIDPSAKKIPKKYRIYSQAEKGPQAMAKKSVRGKAK